MGADLYIVKDENEETGYFRDSYNESNILWRLNLSYWGLEQDIQNIGKIESALTVEQVKILLEEIERRKPTLEKFLRELNSDWMEKNHLKGENMNDWSMYWMGKYNKLVKFLKHAIELESKITWSV